MRDLKTFINQFAIERSPVFDPLQVPFIQCRWTFVYYKLLKRHGSKERPSGFSGASWKSQESFLEDLIAIKSIL